MTAYLIANVHEITDAETYDDYLGRVGPTIAKYGGKPLVSCPDIGVFEGSWAGRSLVIVEFPNRAAANAWYDSDDYEALKSMRRKSQIADVIVVDND